MHYTLATNKKILRNEIVKASCTCYSYAIKVGILLGKGGTNIWVTHSPYSLSVLFISGSVKYVFVNQIVPRTFDREQDRHTLNRDLNLLHATMLGIMVKNNTKVSFESRPQNMLVSRTNCIIFVSFFRRQSKPKKAPPFLRSFN